MTTATLHTKLHAMNGCHNRADYKPSYWVQSGYYDSEPGMSRAHPAHGGSAVSHVAGLPVYA